jgi:type II secretory pathway component PulK
MDYGLILAVVAIVVTIIVAVLRSQGSKKQRILLEHQLAHQREELMVLRELVESFNRLTASYDKELDSMRTQMLLTSGEPPKTNETKDEVSVAAEIEMEKEKQKAEKKRQKDEAKHIKKMMKALERKEQTND